MKPVAVLAMSVARTRGVLGEAAMARLRAACALPDARPLERLDDARAAALLPQAEILLTGWGCPALDDAALERAPRLRLLAHAAGTVRGIVGPSVFGAGIAVTHAAAANAIPVAEFTLATILLAAKRVRRFEVLLRAGDLDGVRALADGPLGNPGVTVGLVGASRIGRRVLDLLRPFGFRVLLHDPTLPDAAIDALGAQPATLDALLRAADILSLHAPSLPATRHMIGAPELALLRDGATLINTARGALLDHAALEREVVPGRLDAVLDVTEPEPLPPDSPLLRLPNVAVTPHVAGALGRERVRLGDLAVAEIERFAAGLPLRHAIHAADLGVMA